MIMDNESSYLVISLVLSHLVIGSTRGTLRSPNSSLTVVVSVWVMPSPGERVIAQRLDYTGLWLPAGSARELSEDRMAAPTA